MRIAYGRVVAEIVTTERELDAMAVLAVSELAHRTVEGRLEAGAHPHDALLSGFDILRAFVHVHIDGAWPSEDISQD